MEATEQGCCASAAEAIMLFAATILGIPVSTTHTVTGSVVGVGAARKVSAVRWNVASNIVAAWVLMLFTFEGIWLGPAADLKCSTTIVCAATRASVCLSEAMYVRP